jgi:hypothetical protein
MNMQFSNMADDKLCSALAKAKHLCPDVIGYLHSAYHDGHHLPEGYVAERLKEARANIEKVLVAILAAQQSIAQAPATGPANDHLEAFLGNGAFSA